MADMRENAGKFVYRNQPIGETRKLKHHIIGSFAADMTVVLTNEGTFDQQRGEKVSCVCASQDTKPVCLV